MAQARGTKSRCHQGWFPPGGSEGESIPFLSQLPVVAGNCWCLWLATSNFWFPPLSSQGRFPSASVSLRGVFLFQYRPLLLIKGSVCSSMTSPELVTSAIALFPNKATFWGFGKEMNIWGISFNQVYVLLLFSFEQKRKQRFRELKNLPGWPVLWALRTETQICLLTKSILSNTKVRRMRNLSTSW